MNRPTDPVHWQETQRMTPPRRAGEAADLSAPATQIVADRDAYLGQGSHDVGRRIADDQVELFINGDVAAALQREFEVHASEFIALHDIGTSGSLRLLSGLAGAAGARVQRLSVRRQGQGLALAVLQFVEVPLADGSVVRIYSTDTNADGSARQQIARALLAWSRLGVLLVGDLPPHAMGSALSPLHDAMMRGPWPNREVLMVPLGAGVAMAAQAAQLAGGSAVQIHVTPRAGQPREVWNFIAGTWNRLHGQPGGERNVHTDIERAVPRPAVPRTEAITQPMGLDEAPHEPEREGAAPMPTAPMSTGAAATMPMPIPGATRWQDYVDRCALIKGVQSCCVFDLHSLKPLAHAGLGATRPEAAVTAGQHHLLLRPVPGHPGIALHMVLNAQQANLTLARMQLERVEAPK
jgi:hypothetical protein